MSREHLSTEGLPSGLFGPEARDHMGQLTESEDGDEFVLSWTPPHGQTTEMLRFTRTTGLMRIFPRDWSFPERAFRHTFDRIRELQIASPEWDPNDYLTRYIREDLCQVVGLPRGFASVFGHGLGVRRLYRGLLDEIDERSPCTTVRFTSDGSEGLDGGVFRVSLERFEQHRSAIERNRGRGRKAVQRVNAAQNHNSVADLFSAQPVQAEQARNPVIQALTDEVENGYVMTEADRAELLKVVERQASAVAHEAPQQFGRLRGDLELVSLDVLIEQFELSLEGPRRDESHWQDFFSQNSFALQQVFSAPILIRKPLAVVKSEDESGAGSRIADFLCVNTVTHSAIVVEIKTPSSKLMASQPYRGRDTAQTYPTHRDLSGAVSQLQAQMESVPRHMITNARFGDIDTWHVRGAVITGMVSSLDDERRESFLRYRDGLSTVTVLGYDEVAARLKGLKAALQDQPQPDIGAASSLSTGSTHSMAPSSISDFS